MKINIITSKNKKQKEENIEKSPLLPTARLQLRIILMITGSTSIYAGIVFRH